MSWQLASFAILAAVLLAGFAWYERSRPPAQVVALVAALAALAIAGRIAFAAFPSVKPTTDIVIFAGYALGGAAGFAVGALAALVSNFWFGQGPWTPWQMAGWGMCGLMGAALAAVGGRNAGRLTLAAVCGFAGAAYGALLNFSLMPTYGGELSLEQFLLLESRAVPFDAAHVAANVAFALVAGPAMIRMLTRFRERFEWRRGARDGRDRAPALAATVLLALALATTLPAGAGAASTDSAAGWLVTAQNTDGGFGDSPGESSSPEMTAWAMLGLEAAGRNPLDVAKAGKNPVDYLRSKVGGLESSGDFARTILALEGAGVDPRSFGGRNLVSALLNRRRSDGSYEGWPGSTAFAVIALRSAGVSGGLDQTQSWLGGAQNSDGGWGDTPGAPSNADVTGAAMQAMPSSKAAKQGLSYLRNHQRGNGGFALGSGGAANAQSTAWAVQGIVAVGTDPASVKAGGKSGLDYLTGLQEADGHFRYSSDSNQNPVWVTGQALAAAAGKSFPVAAPPRVPTPTVTPTPTPIPLPKPEALPAVPIPGVTNPPAVPVPPLEAGAAGGGSGGGGSSHAGPLVPESAASPPPVGGAGAILPPGTPPPEESEDLVEATPASVVEPESDDPASPWIPVGIGVGVALLAVLVPLGLGRRFAW
jgi:energy-coupling factor transport system substrate-specific component